MKRKKICFIVSVFGTANSFLRDHIRVLSEDYDIYLVANLKGKEVPGKLEGLKEVKDIPIERKINLGGDISTLSKLTQYFKQEKFDLVHSVTPKAGLLTAMAAKLAGISNRLHIYTGQVWATKTGAMRKLLKSMDEIIAALDTELLTDGESQRQFLIKEGVLRDSNSRVLGPGSISGANVKRFHPTPEERERQREDLGLSPDKVVYVYMGRLNREKGIHELFAAFNSLVEKRPNAFLLIFGRDEENCLDTLPSYKNIHPNDNFLYYGITHSPEKSLQAGDVFCLPSYREGFGMSAVEAACLGLPVICSDVYGLQDTMVEGETGLRCKVKDVKSLEEAMAKLYDEPALRKKFGKQGRERILRDFTGEKIIGEWKTFYDSLLK